MGPPIVIEAGLFVPENDPVPLPVQLVKLKPVAGMALIEIAAPPFLQPLDLTKNRSAPGRVCARKQQPYSSLTTREAGFAALTRAVCEMPPPPLQFIHT